MVLALELINPMYLLVAGGVFIIIIGCACYGCHDMFYSQAEMAAGVIACDASDCEIPDIHEQHILEDKGEGLWSKKAWGMESDDNPAGGDASIMIIPHTGDGPLGLSPLNINTGDCDVAVDCGM